MAVLVMPGPYLTVDLTKDSAECLSLIHTVEPSGMARAIAASTVNQLWFGWSPL